MGGRRLRLGPAPAAPGPPAEMVYYARVPALASSPSGSNWLLEKAPAVYLYGTLLELMPFIRADDRLAGWFALYATAIAGLQAQADRSARSGDALTQRVDSGNPP